MEGPHKGGSGTHIGDTPVERGPAVDQLVDIDQVVHELVGSHTHTDMPELCGPPEDRAVPWNIKEPLQMLFVFTIVGALRGLFRLAGVGKRLLKELVVFVVILFVVIIGTFDLEGDGAVLPAFCDLTVKDDGSNATLLCSDNSITQEGEYFAKLVSKKPITIEITKGGA